MMVGEELRKKWRDFLTDWARSPADRAQYRMDAFVQGLTVLTSFTEATLLATGHGPVLQGHVGELLHDLLMAAEPAS